MVETRTDHPVATFRAEPADVGGFRVEITLRHGGTHPLVDFYQETLGDHDPDLLHPHEGPDAFRPCPSASAPGWTCLGEGVAPGETVGPFVAWCARPPRSFAMRWRAEDVAAGGAFEILGERAVANVSK